MNLKKSLINLFFVLCISSNVHAEDAKPKYSATTFRIFQKNEYIRKNPAPDFWAFMPYYVSQQDGAACGIASMTMLMNASRAHQQLTASDALVTQKALVEKIKVDYSKGLTLDKLSEAIQKSIHEYGLKASLETIHADGSVVQNNKIRELLIKNEKSDFNFIVANFNQGTFTGDPEGGGHISPIGAFDAKKNLVLVMDVDREYYEPYWISFDTFIKGMSTQDTSSKLNRGLIYVELH